MSETPIRVGSVDDTTLDPELREPAPAERVTSLETLREELKQQLVKDVDFEPLTLVVEKRPGVSITYRTDLDDEMLTAFRKRAKRKDHPDGVDVQQLYRVLLAHLCTSINMHGQEVHGDDGRLWNAQHPEVKALFGVPQAGNASQVMAKVIGVDAHVLVHGAEIMTACGYGDEAERLEEGPTQTS